MSVGVAEISVVRPALMALWLAGLALVVWELGGLCMGERRELAAVGAGCSGSTGGGEGWGVSESGEAGAVDRSACSHLSRRWSPKAVSSVRGAGGGEGVPSSWLSAALSPGLQCFVVVEVAVGGEVVGVGGPEASCCPAAVVVVDVDGDGDGDVGSSPRPRLEGVVVRSRGSGSHRVAGLDRSEFVG